MSFLKRKYLYIDSGTQLTANSNTWSSSLDINLDIEAYDRVTLIQCQIPTSYYLVVSGSNQIVLTEGAQSVTILITPGNYNIFSWSSYVAALLTTNSPNGYSYTITYPNSYTSPDTGKFTYTVSSTAQTVSFTFPSTTTVFDQFGFYPNTTNTFVGGILVSAAVVSFVPETSLFIHASCVDAESTAPFSDVLEGIYGFNVQPFSSIVFVNPDPVNTSKKLKSRDRSVTFSICDERGGPIFLNAQNVLLTLMVFQDTMTNVIVEKSLSSLEKSIDYITNEVSSSRRSLDERERNPLWLNQAESWVNAIVNKLDELRNTQSQSSSIAPNKYEEVENNPVEETPPQAEESNSVEETNITG